MKIHIWGTDFRRTTAESRKALFIPPEQRLEAIRNFLSLGFHDLVYLWTCNRVEFFTTAEDYFTDTKRHWEKLFLALNLPETTYFQGYHFEGKAALRHLVRVASSLDSLVIGEPQILGQLKDSVAWTKENQLPLEKSLERCFQVAFETAKRVRTETSIAEKPVSVATLGIEHFKKHEKELGAARVVVVGRSPISRIVVEWFQKNRPQTSLLWVNRKPELLAEFQGQPNLEFMKLSEFLETPPSFSHLFTATSSDEPIFKEEFLRKLETTDKVLFDFAQPPDVALIPEDMGQLKLIHMEDLMTEAEANSLARAQAVGEAEKLIEVSLREYFLEQKEAPILKEFSSVEPRLIEELTLTYRFIENEFPEILHAQLKKFAEKLVRKNLHHSREHLRSVLRGVSSSVSESTLPPVI